ncbi:hypothetical protein L1887_57332 [Cichorium endivia]|nr:hypothetical protein L1887_57332 [Cichorium endivia]
MAIEIQIPSQHSTLVDTEPPRRFQQLLARRRLRRHQTSARATRAPGRLAPLARRRVRVGVLLVHLVGGGGGAVGIDGPLDETGAVPEARAEEHVGVGKEPFLERHDDKLAAPEPVAEELANVLRVAQVERRIDLVQDVHRRRLELQQTHDEAERNQTPLPARQLGQTLLPHGAQTHLDLESLRQLLPLRRLQLGRIARQQLAKDRPKIGVDLGPGVVQRIALVAVQLGDRVFDLALVLEHGGEHGLERRLLLLDTLDHREHLGIHLLAHPLLRLLELLAPLAHVGHVVLAKVVHRARLPEEALFGRDPLKLVLQLRDRLFQPGHVRHQLLALVRQLLDRQRTIRDLLLLGLERRPQRRQLVVVARQRRTLLAQLGLDSLHACLQRLELLLHRRQLLLHLADRPLALGDRLFARRDLAARLLQLELQGTHLALARLDLAAALRHLGLLALEVRLELVELRVLVLVKLVHLLFQPLGLPGRLLLARPGRLDGLAQLADRRLGLVHLGDDARGVGSADLRLEQRHLVPLELDIALGLREAGHVRLGRVHLRLDLGELGLRLLERTLDLDQVLHLDQHAARAGLAAARERARRVVHVAVERDALHAHRIVKGDALGRRRVGAHERVAKHVLHRAAHLVVVADERERQVHLARRQPLRCAHLFGAGDKRVDLVERDERDAFPELAVGEQLGAHLFVLDDDIVQAAARADLERGRVFVLVLVELDERGDETLDARAVKVGLGIGVLEVHAGEPGLERLLALEQIGDAPAPLGLGLQQRLFLVVVPAELLHVRLELLHCRTRRLELAQESRCILLRLAGERLLLLDLLLQVADAQLGLLDLGARRRLLGARRGDLAHVAACRGLAGLGLGRGCHAGEQRLQQLVLLGHVGDRSVVVGLELGEGAGKVDELSFLVFERLVERVERGLVRLELLALLVDRAHLEIDVGLALDEVVLKLLALVDERLEFAALGHLCLLLLFDLCELPLDALDLAFERLGFVLTVLHVLGLAVDEGLALFVLCTELLPLVGLGETREAVEFGGGLLVLEEGSLLLAELVELGRDLLLEQRGDLLDLLIFLGHGLDGFVLAILEHARSGRLFDHGEDLCGLHVEHLCDLALHDEEVGVVDVELDALKHVLHRLLRGLVAVDEVLAGAPHGDLAGDCDLRAVFERHWRFFAVGVVKDDGDGGLGDAGLATLVDEVLEVVCAHGSEVGDAKHKAD